MGLVLIDNQTGEPTISYRGTDIKNSQDLITDALALFGQEKISPEYGLLKEQLEAVTELYGKPKELLGFSRGSVLSMNLGNDYGIDTTQLNPLISPSLLNEQSSGSNHNIFRTLNDPVSILAKGKLASNTKWKIRSILPIRDTVNPIEEHYLKQFLSNDTPRRSSVEEILLNRIIKQGNIAAEYTMMKEMYNNIEQKNTFTSYMRIVNPADADITTTQRVYKGSNYTEMWKQLGGSFSEEENLAINRNQIGNIRPFETTLQQRKSFSNLDELSKKQLINTANENLKNVLETQARYSVEPNTIRNNLIKENTLFGTSPEISQLLVETLNPVSNIKGLAGGFAGFEEAKLLDNLTGGLLGGTGTAVVGGGLGSINTSLASAALAGSTETLTAAALLPEIAAGSIGGLVGYESSIAIAKALKDAGANEETIKSVSEISGGGIGGASTAIVGIAGSIAAAGLTGGEIGSVLAPETAGLSIAIGAGLGATIGGLGYLGSQVISAANTLIEQIKSPSIDPYYVDENYNSMDHNSVFAFLQKQEVMRNLERQDQSMGITPEQRVEINKSSAIP